MGDVDGGQGEAVRAPLADGTLVKLPVAPDSALVPSLLTLSDVLGTGHHAAVRGGFRSLFLGNITLTGGPAPARAYVEELMADILESRIEPGKVFDRTVDLAGVPEGYDAMAAREALKVLVRP
jgi:threonine dehydrogenase-like Zn-dependent dehydrogenase